jgi:Nucleotidyl transferase AbiEii toxin, Type IV TA system
MFKSIKNMKLHYNTISKKALEILKFLMTSASLKDFYLVGGTALSLQWGHRISDDIDMFRFSEEEVDGTLIYDEISTFSGVTKELGRQNY